jgi:hypothetical protein
LRPELPAAIDAVLERGLAKTPEGRYATAPELVDAAKAAFASSATTVAVAPMALPPAPTASPRGAMHAPQPGPDADLAGQATRVDPPAHPRRPARTDRRRPFALGAPLLGLIVALPLVLGGAILAGLMSGSLGTPASTSGATTSPITSAASLASTPASPSSIPYFAGATTDEQYLLQRVPATLESDCGRYKPGSTAPEPPRDVAGVTCPVGRPDVASAMYFRFASSDAMQQWWRARIQDRGLQPDSGGCEGGRPGETSYDSGRLLCFVSSSTGRLLWIDEGALIYGVVNGRTARLPAILQWWLGAHAAQGLRSDPLFLPVEQALVAEAPADIAKSCIPYRIVATNDKFVKGNLGGIDCLLATKLVEDVGYFELPTLGSLRSWWRERLTSLKVKADSGACVHGKKGETDTGHGRIACYLSPGGQARIRWTDDTRLVYGTVNGVTGNLAGLFEWWDARH